MTDLTSVAKESVKGLGAGAYLVSVLPSLVLVLVLFALDEFAVGVLGSPRDRAASA